MSGADGGTEVMSVSDADRKMSQELSLIAADGTKLSGRWFPAASDHQKVVLIAGATAVPQGFYRRFALAMNARGYHALSFDYRGIGLSKPSTLKGYHAGFREWGEQDLAAAVNYAKRFGSVYLAGHSFAGHGLGMLGNIEQIQAAWICGTGAGYSGYMPLGERLKVELLWRLLAPVGTAFKGYAPMSWFGIGEDLPKECYRNWKHWCGFPHYFFDDPALQGSEFLQRFAAVRTPICVVNSEDDLWALPKSRDAFMKGYQSAQISRLDLSPAQFALEQIGHMGYFRPALSGLWEQAADYFDRHSLAGSG